VYLAADSTRTAALDQKIFERPQAGIVGGGAFQPKLKESPRETAARCYPALIAARRQSYEALAHCTLQVASLAMVRWMPPRFWDDSQQDRSRPMSRFGEVSQHISRSAPHVAARRRAARAGPRRRSVHAVEIARHSPEELEEFRRLPFTEVCFRVAKPFAAPDVPEEALWQVVSEAINFP